jgi:hypothetical protein
LREINHWSPGTHNIITNQSPKGRIVFSQRGKGKTPKRKEEEEE